MPWAELVATNGNVKMLVGVSISIFYIRWFSLVRWDSAGGAPLWHPVEVCAPVGLWRSWAAVGGGVRQGAQVVADPGRYILAGHGHQDDQTLSSAALSAIAQWAL